jgi:hypothetical protein
MDKVVHESVVLSGLSEKAANLLAAHDREMARQIRNDVQAKAVVTSKADK